MLRYSNLKLISLSLFLESGPYRYTTSPFILFILSCLNFYV